MDQDKMKFACSTCDKVYLTGGALNKHVRRTHSIHHRDKPCAYCDKSFWSSTELNNHIRTHTGEHPYPCPQCNLRFARKGDLDRHVRHLHRAGEVPSNPCPAPGCLKTFAYPSDLKRHLATHDKARPTYPCPNCNKLYHSRPGLAFHEKFYHRGSGREHVCTYCQMRFHSSSRLAAHSRSHTNEKPYACAMCLRTFRQLAGLRVHEARFHTDARPYGCKQCDKRFKCASVLLTHEETHKSERERRLFECLECGKNLTTKAGLKFHMAVHMDREEYQNSCPICDKKFAKPEHLRLHVMVHTGEKPHVCNECGKAFGTRGQLRRHQRTIHEEANTSSN